MLGTTYKVGFDAKAVRQGLGGLTGLMGRAMRQVGIGGLRKVGENAMGILTRIVAFLPQSIKETLDWAGSMTDMATQTRMSVRDLMELEEAMRLAGASSGDASMMVSKFKQNLFLAATEAGPAREALNALGISAQELDANDVVGSMQKVAQALGEAGLEAGQMEDVFAALFGARGGMKMIRVMTNLDETLQQARRNLGGFQDDADGLFPVFDAISDTMGRWTMIRRQMMAGFLKGMFGKDAESAADFSQQIMNLLQRVTGLMHGVGKAIGPVFKWVLDVVDAFAMLGAEEFFKSALGGIKSFFTETIIEMARSVMTTLGTEFMEMASAIGEAIGSAIQSSLGVVGEVGSSIYNGIRRIGGAVGIGGGKSPDKTTSQLLQESKNQTALLDRIHRDGTTAVFA